MRRITSSARPMDHGGPVLPMEAEQERFWRLRKGEPVKTGILQRIFGRNV